MRSSDSTWVHLGQLSFRYRGLLFPVAVVLLLVPSPHLSSDPALLGVCGLLIALVGQAIRVATIGLAYIIRGGKDHRVYAEDLVTQGIYAHCRNPMYLGNAFLLAGLAVASNSWIFVLAGVPLVAVMHWAMVAAEENFLRGKFGAAFEAYCASVPRWLPRLGGLATTFRSMRFDWPRVTASEYAKPFDWVAAINVIVIINLWRADALAAYPQLVAIMVLMIFARLILWRAALAFTRRAQAAPTHP